MEAYRDVEWRFLEDIGIVVHKKKTFFSERACVFCE
jgi:hypothetical protein